MLSQCRDCGREVSTRANHCVHCGRPWPASNCAGLSIVAGIGIAVLLTVGTAAFFCAKRKCESMKGRSCVMEPASPKSISAPAPVAPAKEE